MPIAMRCPGCETRFEFANDLEGKRIKCKTCGDVFRVERPARKPRDLDEDDRPSRRRDEDDRPSGRYRIRLGDEDRPRKKAQPGLVLGVIVGVVLLFTGGIVAAVLLSRGGKKKDGPVDPSDVVVAPTKSCPLEVPEKDADLLVLPDGGNLFGVLRSQGTGLKKAWTYDPYDLAAGRRVGRVELAGVEDPKTVSLSPDGKRLLVVESKGFGWGWDHQLTVWSVADGKNLTPDKWSPFPRKGGASEDLYRAEFVAPDLIVTVGTGRSVYRYQVPSFEVTTDRVAGKDDLGRMAGLPENAHRTQYQVGFSADRRRMAVWNGSGYTVVNTRGGGEDAFATPSVVPTVRELWRGEPFLDRLRGGGVAFSPDGKVLAGVVSHDAGNRRHLLFLWELKGDVADPVNAFEIPANQFNEAPGLSWWGNRFVVTGGSKVEGMVIDVRTGLGRRQLMGPEYNRYGFSRDGRLWYAAGPGRLDPATMYVVDGPDPDVLKEPDDYEQILELGQEFFLKRLWLEPGGVLRKPTRYAPDLHKRLIRRP